MIAVILTVFIVISTVFSAFFVYVNNINAMIDTELQERVEDNAVLYGLQFGQISSRAKTLDPAGREITLGYVKKIKDTELEQVAVVVKYVPATGNIEATFKKR